MNNFNDDMPDAMEHIIFKLNKKELIWGRIVRFVVRIWKMVFACSVKSGTGNKNERIMKNCFDRNSGNKKR